MEELYTHTELYHFAKDTEGKYCNKEGVQQLTAHKSTVLDPIKCPSILVSYGKEEVRRRVTVCQAAGPWSFCRIFPLHVDIQLAGFH